METGRIPSGLSEDKIVKGVRRNVVNNQVGGSDSRSVINSRDNNNIRGSGRGGTSGVTNVESEASRAGHNNNSLDGGSRIRMRRKREGLVGRKHGGKKSEGISNLEELAEERIAEAELLGPSDLLVGGRNNNMGIQQTETAEKLFVQREADNEEGETSVVELTEGILPTQNHHRPHSHHHNREKENNSEQAKTTKATGMSVRCHCNLASCVTSNYMCKSEVRIIDGKELEAGCFVEELETEGTTSKSSHIPAWNGRVTTARRGCVDLLSKEKQARCSRDPGTGQILCCTQDMCNWPKSFYPNSIQNLNNHRSSFDPSGLGGGSMGGIRGGGAAGMTPNLDHQVWLRAAVIAVPICGLFILVALIIVARRLLQSEDYKDPEGRRSRRKSSSSSPSGMPHNFTYSPYAPTNGFIPHSSTSSVLPPSVHAPSGSSLMGGGGGGSLGNPHLRSTSYGMDSSFDLKPGYATETSELLSSPSEYQFCINCQGHGNNSLSRQGNQAGTHYHRSQSAAENNSGNSFNARGGNQCNNNNQHSGSSGGASGIEDGGCGGCNRGAAGGDRKENSMEGDVLLGVDCNSDTDESTLDGSYTGNTRSQYRAGRAVFTGSSPVLVMDSSSSNNNNNNRFAFLSKIGLSRSTESANDSCINSV